MEGNRKPLLRSLPSGKDTHGRYTRGTPLKSTRAPRPVPIRSRVSSVMVLAFSSQLLSRGGQVVKVTPRRRNTPCGVSLISSALPRAARWIRSNSADLKSAPADAE